MSRRPRAETEYVVQVRSARRRGWVDYQTVDPRVEPFKRHRDAANLAKELTDRPENRGHDWYYRVLPRPKKEKTCAP